MEKLTRKEAFALSMDVYHRKSSVADYSAEERAEGLRNYLNDLNKDYRNNKNEIFQIIEDTVNEILPIKVRDYVRNWAEFKTFDNNTQVRFKITKGKIKAVAVAVGGGVSRNRVDKGWFTVKTEAIQCKIYEEYERVIGGLVDWNELVNMVADAITEAILIKIYQAFINIYNQVPAVNSHSATTLDKTELDNIINVVKAYGSPIIMGTSRALAQITLDAYASDADKMDIRNRGYLGVYKGCQVMEIPQSFEDETNAVKILDDQYIFIMPVGVDNKPVKVAMEGGLITRENSATPDWTWNFEAYQKVGVAVPIVNHIGVYRNTSLA